MLFYLKSNIVGKYSGRLYGECGDEVSLIEIHEEVAIVTNGIEAFPVSVLLISEEKPLVDKTEPQEQPEITQSVSRRKPGTKSKHKTQSLFKN